MRHMYLRYLLHIFTCTFTHLVLGLLAKIKCSIGASQVAQFSSVTQLCPTFVTPCMDCSMPGFPVYYQLLEFIQTHVHWVGDAIPGGTVVKNLPVNAGDAKDVGLIPGIGNGNSLQYSCLNNSVDRGAWWPTGQGSQRVGHDWANCMHTHSTEGCPWMNRSF